MAIEFSIRQLSVLAYAQGFTLWHYAANRDNNQTSLETIAKTNYFDDARGMLVRGDMIMVSAHDGGKIFMVSDTNGPVVLAPLA